MEATRTASAVFADLQRSFVRGEIAYADSALARFVAYLKASGKYRNALIVV